MKSDRSIKIAICLTLLASFPLGLWSFLLSKRIAQGGVLWIFPDSLVPALVATCVWLTVVAVGYAMFILLRAFCSGAIKPGHLVVICVIWVVGTFALHCWVLHGLVHMPPWASAKRDSDDAAGSLNGMLTGYAGTGEDRARARAAMQMQMPGRGVTVPSVEQKLAIALRFEENQHGYLKTVAGMGENAGRLIARRAWISWATTALTPVIVLALGVMRTRRLAKMPPPTATASSPQPSPP